MEMNLSLSIYDSISNRTFMHQLFIPLSLSRFRARNSAPLSRERKEAKNRLHWMFLLRFLARCSFLHPWKTKRNFVLCLYIGRGFFSWKMCAKWIESEEESGYAGENDVRRENPVLGLRRDALKPFGAVWLSHLLVEVFLLMHPALVPVFIQEFSLSIFQAGLLIAIPSVCRLVIVIPTGVLADKYGSLPFIILSLLIGGVSALILSQTTSVLVLTFSITLIMISVTLYHPPGMSVVSALFPARKERSAAIGWHGASGCIGQSLGTISLGLLLAQYGWRFSYLLFTFPLLFWALALTRIRIPQLARKTNPEMRYPAGLEVAHDLSRKTSFNRLGFFVLVSAMGLNGLANGGISAFMTTYLTSTQNLSVDVASIIFGVGPLIGIVGSIATGYVSARFGDKNSLMLIFLGQFVFLLGLIAVPFVFLAMLCFLMYQLFLHALWTPSTSMVASLMGKTGGGTAYSVFYFAHDLLGAGSPLMAAVLIERSGLGLVSPFIFATSLLFLCALLVRLIRLE